MEGLVAKIAVAGEKWKNLTDDEKTERLESIRDVAAIVASSFGAGADERYAQLVTLHNGVHAHWPSNWREFRHDEWTRLFSSQAVAAATTMLQANDIEKVMQAFRSVEPHSAISLTRVCAIIMRLVRGIAQTRVFELLKNEAI